MRIRDPQTLLDYEAGRRPALAGWLQQLGRMSEDEINRLPVLKWMRQAMLARRREQFRTTACETITASLAGHIVDGHNPDPHGVILRWQGPDGFLPLDRGAVEVRTGRLLWIDDAGSLWFEHIRSTRIDPRVASQTAVEGRATRSEYTRRYRDEAAHAAPLDAPLIGQAGVVGQAGVASPLAAYGVRLFRPGA